MAPVASIFTVKRRSRSSMLSHIVMGVTAAAVSTDVYARTNEPSGSATSCCPNSCMSQSVVSTATGVPTSCPLARFTVARNSLATLSWTSAL